MEPNQQVGTAYIKNSAVELQVNPDQIENCGSEEWTYNWYLYRQLEIAHWHYEDWYCKKHHVSTTTKTPFFMCYPMKSGDDAFYNAFLKQFPVIAQKIGDLEEARKARNEQCEKLNVLEELFVIGVQILPISQRCFYAESDVSSRKGKQE